MDLLGNPLTTHPIQTAWEISIEPYLSWRFGCIDNPDLQFGNGSIWTWTQTWSDGLELLLTLGGPEDNDQMYSEIHSEAGIKWTGRCT